MTATDRRIVWCYIIDRAGQYDQGSGIVTALENVAVAIANGEAESAAKHGELDDLMERARKHGIGSKDLP